MEEDKDLAFQLQVEEALTPSLIDGAVSSPDPSYDAVFGPALSTQLQGDSLIKYERELLDIYQAEAEAKMARLDLTRQIHDRAFACEVASIPEHEWRITGDHFNRPYGEGSANGQVQGFRVYVKGLTEKMVGGIGVAVGDGNDRLVFEVSKGFNWSQNRGNAEMVEMKALVEGLDVAIMLGIENVTVISDNPLLYRYNGPSTSNSATLSDRINLLVRKFSHIRASPVASKDVKFAFELARKAVAFQASHSAGSSKGNTMTENCAICFEDKYVDEMFSIMGCMHRYCFSCMSKHSQFQLLQGMMPKCPHENCKSDLKFDSCKKFLSPELLEIMSQRMKEESIPASEKVYCPYPKCSTLYSKTELLGSGSNSKSAVGQLARIRCPKCGGMFCINCKVAWHSNMTCLNFKRQNPYSGNEDKKLNSLASKNLWRQCPKCNHMVSLATGCYHIYCRCGHEFCYTCGAEWKKQETKLHLSHLGCTKYCIWAEKMRMIHGLCAPSFSRVMCSFICSFFSLSVPVCKFF